MTKKYSTPLKQIILATLLATTAPLPVAAEGAALNAIRPMSREDALQTGYIPLKRPENLAGVLEDLRAAQIAEQEIKEYRETLMSAPYEHEATTLPEESQPISEKAQEVIEEVVLKPMPLPLEWSTVSLAGFSERKEKVIRNYIESKDSAQAALKVADFYLSYMFGVEAQSILSAMNPGTLSPEDLAEYKKYYTIARIINKSSYDGRLFIAGNAEYEEWEDYALWTVLDDFSKRTPRKHAHLIAQAASDLNRYSDLHKSELIFKLLEAAILSDEWSTAKNIADYIDGTPHLANTTAYNYLVALAAEKNGEVIIAFDHYTDASTGEDQYAQRARLAIIRIGLTRNAMPLQDAETYLLNNLHKWKGDLLELEGMYQLQAVYRAMQDKTKELKVLGDILFNFSKMDETLEARDRADALLEQVYEEGTSGELSVGEFVKVHQEVAPYFYYFPGFLDKHEIFADKVLSLGITAMAADEYGRLIELKEVASDMEGRELPYEEYVNITLKKVDAMMRGADFDGAAKTIGLINREIIEDALAQRYDASLSKILQENDALAELIQHSESMPNLKRDSKEYLHTLGRSYRITGQWEKALAVWFEMEEGFDLTTNDATEFLVAAHRAGEVDTVLRLLEQYPELSTTESGRNITSRLRYDPASLAPLKLTNIETRLTEADAAINASQ